MNFKKEALPLLLVMYAAVVSIYWCITGGLNHDEHQFLASAFMVMQYGLHPYQDFAYFHMPNLVYIYAPFFLTPYPFLLARLFVGLCGIGICLILYFFARKLFSSYNKLISLLIPSSVCILFIHAPLYQSAVSCIWNHTPSTFFALLAFLLHCRGLFRSKSIYLFLSGTCLGMAIGIRLSFAPLLLPFIFTIVFFQKNLLRMKVVDILAFSIGGLLPNIPAIYFFFTHHEAFWFGNLGYARLNTLYREEMGWTTAMSLPGKIHFLFKIFFKEKLKLPAVLAYLYCFIIFAIDRIRKPAYLKFETIFLLFSIPFLLLGSFAPTPSWYQYHFVLVPFLLLLTINGLADIRNVRLLKTVVGPLMVAAMVSFFYGSPLLRGSTIKNLKEPRLLALFSLNEEAGLLVKLIGKGCQNGKVLTLSPLSTVIAKLPIYKEFVTGPFGWRVSHLIPEEMAEQNRLPLRSKIEQFIKKHRPCAIITGREKMYLEQSLVDAAFRWGYRLEVMPSGAVVWLQDKSK